MAKIIHVTRVVPRIEVIYRQKRDLKIAAIKKELDESEKSGGNTAAAFQKAGMRPDVNYQNLSEEEKEIQWKARWDLPKPLTEKESYEARIEHNKKIKNKIIRAILKKNIIDIGIDGRLMIESKCSVGARIRVLFLSTQPEASDEATLYDRLDKKKSGDYLIMAVQNYFRQENHAATLRLAKIGDIPEDAEI